MQVSFTSTGLTSSNDSGHSALVSLPGAQCPCRSPPVTGGRMSSVCVAVRGEDTGSSTPGSPKGPFSVAALLCILSL